MHVLRESWMEGEFSIFVLWVFYYKNLGGLRTFLDVGTCLQVFRVPETASVLLR